MSQRQNIQALIDSIVLLSFTITISCGPGLESKISDLFLLFEFNISLAAL